ncbi:hypothetical protein LTR48_005173 [Friedmanniomyces endolithicus]|uniref:Translation machinery-associated protein 22 n=1 Tax=Rachicladosporium monterosium TaxID=1507873 RepID=A0ABR0KYS2_9PEZI|nr:hypothetical protein LTR48_005173 [Friedmanniomyces endolithicus]KAK5140812.1 hypothetical protein LTR32_006484 [Rachicladosporium monterosium]
MVALLHTPEVVVKKLQGGADLMTPGLAGGPPFPERAKRGAVVAVASLEKPSVPVAVGVCAIDVCSLQKVQGERGHAVETLHWAGDDLWSYSTNETPGRQAPEEIEGWKRLLEEQQLDDKVAGTRLEDEDEEGGVSLGGSSNGQSAPEKENGEQAASGNSKVAGSEKEAREQAGVEELSQEEIDDTFRKAFIYGVYHHKTTQASAPNHGLVFPLTQSIVMSALIQPFLPAFTPEQSNQLQMKKTSWKNMKKFIKTLDKQKLLRSKEQNGHETVILDIDFEDKAFAKFEPYPLPKKEVMTAGSQGQGDGATGQTDADDDAVGQRLQVMSYYKPTSKLQPLFEGAGRQLFTPPEVRELVTAYIEKADLISATNRRLIKLDPILGNAIFYGSGSLDKEVLAKGTVPREALVDRVLHAMSLSHAIVRNGADPGTVKPKSGGPPRIHITLETRSGNKTVTKVSGMEAYHINTRLLADELRKTCASSTSVEPLAGATKKNEKEIMEVMIQGPQKAAVVKALERRGVQTKWVEVLDKTKKKK